MTLAPQTFAGRKPLPLGEGMRGAPLAPRDPGPPGATSFAGLEGTLAVNQLPAPIAVSGVGYATGFGGTVTQLTDKSTTVILNKYTGTIVTDAANLNAGTVVSFTVTNSLITATDLVVIQHDSGGTIGGYLVLASNPAVGSFKINLRNVTAGALAEALTLRFAIVRGAVT